MIFWLCVFINDNEIKIIWCFLFVSLSVEYDGIGNGCSSLDVFIMVVLFFIVDNMNFWKFLICLMGYFIVYILVLNR